MNNEHWTCSRGDSRCYFFDNYTSWFSRNILKIISYYMFQENRYNFHESLYWFFFIFLIIILCFFYKPQKINDFLNVTYFKPGGFYFWNKRHNYKKWSTCFSIASYLSKSPISFFSIWEIDKSLEYTFKWL